MSNGNITISALRKVINRRYIKTKFGLFEPLVMFFRLCNSLAMFQAMMDKIAKHLQSNATTTHILLLIGNLATKKDLDYWSILPGPISLLLHDHRTFVPLNNQLERKILSLFHNSLLAGHPGEKSIYNALAEYFWWNSMQHLVHQYVKGCATYQQNKINQQGSPCLLLVPGLKTIWPFTQILMDFIMDPSKSHGFNSILCIVDHRISKGIILALCKKLITASETTQLLIDHLYQRFGLPEKIKSDWGLQFASRSFCALLKQLGITSWLSTAFYPQSDRSTECFNQEIKMYLSIYCISKPLKWAK